MRALPALPAFLFLLALLVLGRNVTVLHHLSLPMRDHSPFAPPSFAEKVDSQKAAVTAQLSLPGESALGRQNQYGAPRADSDKPTNHPTTTMVPTVTNCSSFHGVLLITHLGTAEGAGTAFFNLVVDQLLYAEMHRLQPVVLPDAQSVPCYDPHHHAKVESVTVSASRTGEATPIVGEGDLECRLLVRGGKKRVPYPGPPTFNAVSHAANATMVVTGNNMWTSYFQPVSSTVCDNVPVINLHSFVEMPGLHKCAPFGVRSWNFRGLPTALAPQSAGYQEWFYPMRLRASRIVQKYIHPVPSIREMADAVNPSSSCLALHIRATDKGNGRAKVPLSDFRPYVKAFDGGPVYLATDDASVVKTVQRWATRKRKLYYQETAFRSTSSQPTFEVLQNNTHRTNVESLVDIYAMAKCDFFVHGFSAMAEAVMYLHLDLHNRSINLDDPQHMSVAAFQHLVEVYVTKRDRAQDSNDS